MAQSEGRTLRRAPKQIIKRTAFFVLLVAVATAFGLGVHFVRVTALSTMHGQAVQIDTSNTAAKTAAVTSNGATTQQTSTTTQDCVKGHYDLPTAINLAALPVGLTTIQDSPQTYTIYGKNADEQVQQLQRCAPVADFAGAASYQISWMYSYTTHNDGTCSLVSPKIGLHLNMTMPRWIATSDADSSTRAAWANFSSGLLVHENGHYDISRRYAAEMLKKLRSMSAVDCTLIQSRADTIMQAELKQLETAQNNYDATTNHGATQGASL